ncbi:MarR family winged helix-turn-helix transcriptional regulator [Microbacterium sp. BR1]|uniref:MarR family winged helix-turn-helix transcriptional regulator n=1 Tax=Microbacterium sp. BR1 TaxID=1070896 RepID=UPI001E3CEB43|nr:MarR family winged helix-turn-helix transcriptional regulator [Microbacterium sp. BR1]
MREDEGIDKDMLKDMDRGEIISTIVLSAQALARIVAQEARNDTPVAQWRALGILERDGARRIGELSTISRTTQPWMTRLVGEMDRAGLVTRTRDPLDSRVTVVTITPTGSAALQEWQRGFREVLEPRFVDLSDKDWRMLLGTARILQGHAQEPLPSEDVDASTR